MAEVQAAMDAARGPVQQATRGVQLAREELQLVENRRAMAALLEHR